MKIQQKSRFLPKLVTLVICHTHFMVQQPFQSRHFLFLLQHQAKERMWTLWKSRAVNKGKPVPLDVFLSRPPLGMILHRVIISITENVSSHGTGCNNWAENNDFSSPYEILAAMSTILSRTKKKRKNTHAKSRMKSNLTL